MVEIQTICVETFFRRRVSPILICSAVVLTAHDGLQRNVFLSLKRVVVTFSEVFMLSCEFKQVHRDEACLSLSARCWRHLIHFVSYFFQHMTAKRVSAGVPSVFDNRSIGSSHCVSKSKYVVWMSETIVSIQELVVYVLIFSSYNFVLWYVCLERAHSVLLPCFFRTVMYPFKFVMQFYTRIYQSCKVKIQESTLHSRSVYSCFTIA